MRIISFLFTAYFVLSSSVSLAETVIENKAQVPLLTPSLKERQILKIRLDNGLEAILISDPKIDKSAAALSVKAGSWLDPKEHPGMAHFLEHMLFLGTKKYPEESGYQHFIAKHGGLTNAFTTNDFTSFMFSVNTDAFDEAMDRFAEFFKEPLFNPSGVSRELQAIDQEYAKNVENDDFRLLYVTKAFASPEHPNHDFGMGNSSTLSNVTRDELVDWYNKHYSANLMKLIVYSPLPLEELKAIVIKDFTGIENKNIPESKAPQAPIVTPESLGNLVYIEPIKEIDSLTILWYLPPKFAEMGETQPENLACYVLGHEGTGSLLKLLKEEQLADGLQCGGAKVGPESLAFYIDLTLTKKGVEHLNTVIERVFQAINGFKKEGLSEDIFKEIQQTGKIKYQYTAREDIFDIVTKDAGKLHYEKTETYPEQGSLIRKFDPAALKELLSNLTPKNALFLLASSPKQTGVKSDTQEKWLGVKYAIKPFNEELLNEWSRGLPSPQFHLPKENPLIPNDLSIQNKIIANPDENQILMPKVSLILDNKQAKVYFAPDNFFGVPKIFWQFEIKTPQIRVGDARKTVLAELFVKSLQEAVNTHAYDAELAGLSFEVKATDNGINLIIDGYNDKAHILFDEIIKDVVTVQVDESEFNIHKTSLEKKYQNAAKESPLTQASALLKSTIYKNYSTDKQKLAALKKINFEAFKDFLELLFKKSFVEGTLYGNIKEKQALDVAEKLVTILKSEPYPKEKQLQKEVIVLPENGGPFYLEHKISVQGNSIILATECPYYSFEHRAAQQILMQAIGGPFFSTLRTKQQTGYIVGSVDEEIERKLFNLFFIQSNTHDVHELLARVEIFLEEFAQEIGKTEIDNETFQTLKTALKQNLKSSFNNTRTMGELIALLAFKYNADFDWMNKRLKGFDSLSYAEFKNIAEILIGRYNKRRVAILMKGSIPEDRIFDYHRMYNPNQLKKISLFLNSNQNVNPDQQP